MKDDYVGLHGRQPSEREHMWADAKGEVRHFVPLAWEELNRGICPGCGRTVSWSDAEERWLVDPSLTVLVLTREEILTVEDALRDRQRDAEADSRHRALSEPEKAMAKRRGGFAYELRMNQVDRQYSLNRPE